MYSFLHYSSNNKDTANFQGTHEISVTNNCGNSVTYNFGSILAGTATVESATSDGPAPFPPPVDGSSLVSVSITPWSLQLSPGETGIVTAVFDLATGFDAHLLPVYSGFITVQSSAPGDMGTLQIPFMGVAFNMTTLPDFDVQSGFPQFTGGSALDNGTVIVANGAVFTMNVATNDFPTIINRLLFGSRVVRLDVLPANDTTAGTRVVAGFNILGSDPS